MAGVVAKKTTVNRAIAVSDHSEDEDESSEEFQQQLDLAIARSLDDLERAPQVASSALEETHDLSGLSYEEQVKYVVEKSKIDQCYKNQDVPGESDDLYLLQCALQLSRDPYEQVSQDIKDLMLTLYASCLDSDKSDVELAAAAAAGGKSPPTKVSCRLRENGALCSVGGRSRKRGRTSSNSHSSSSSSTGSSSHSKEPSRQASEPEATSSCRTAAYLSSGGREKKKNEPVLPPPTFSQVAGKKPLEPLPSPAGRSAAKTVYASPRNVILAQFNCDLIDRRSCSPGNRRRPIIIDGCNVAYQHGKNEKFSAKGLLIMYHYFVKRFGYRNDEIYIFCKPTTMNKEDRRICDDLHQMDVLVWTPSRRVGAQYFTSDDDAIILEKAKEVEGVVVSLDQFRDAYHKRKDLRQVIRIRILPFMFKGDELMFSNDPLGSKGPKLQAFLKY